LEERFQRAPRIEYLVRNVIGNVQRDAQLRYPAADRPHRLLMEGLSRTSAGTPSPSIRRIRAVRRLRAICRFDLCTAELPRRDGRVLACSRMREHFSIEREDSQTEPRHNGPLGRPALQVRDLRARSHKIPSAHFLHPDSTL